MSYILVPARRPALRAGTAAAAPPDPGDPGTLLFHSEWSFALGRSQEALRDGNGTTTPFKWTGGHSGSGTPGVAPDFGLDVIARGALNFPTTNVLRHVATSNRAGTGRCWKYGLGVPAAGSGRFYRVYAQFVGPDTWTDQTHPIEDTSLGVDPGNQIECALRWDNTTPGFYNVDYRLGTGNPTYDLDTSLTKGVTYVFEHARFRLPGGTTFQFHARITDTSGTVLFTDEDWDGSAGGTLASNPTFSHVDSRAFDGWQVGMNGVDEAAGLLDVLCSYQAAAAIKEVAGPFSESDWIGLYPHPDEE